jgi:carboxypeptidase Taq
VQLFEAALKEHPEIPGEMERGEFGTLLAWLRENVHH